MTECKCTTCDREVYTSRPSNSYVCDVCIAVLKATTKRLNSALTFYADQKNYQLKYRPREKMEMMVVKDNGDIARQALGTSSSTDKKE